MTKATVIHELYDSVIAIADSVGLPVPRHVRKIILRPDAA